MPAKTRAKTKTKRHTTSQDAERDAIRAGLRRAVQREKQIQTLNRQLVTAMQRTQIGLEQLHSVLTELVTEDLEPAVLGAAVRDGAV